MFPGSELASLWTWLAGIFTVLTLLYIIGTWTYDAFRRRNMFYLAPKVPFLGNVGPVFTGAVTYPDMVMHLYNKAKGWKYIGLFEFRTPFVLLRDPELIKDIMVKYFDNFTAHRSLAYQDLDPIIARSIFSLGGDDWRRMKHHMSPVFTSSRLRTQIGLLRECAEYTRQHLEERLHQHEATKPGDKALEVDFKDIYTKFSANVICSIAYGIGINSYENPDMELFQAGRIFSSLGTSEKALVVAGYMLCPKLMHLLGIPLMARKYHDTLHDAVKQSMDQRQEKNTVRPDVIQLLLSMKQQEESFSDKDFAAIASTFYIASLETVSTQLFLICYLLAIHPEVQRRAQEEVDSVLGDGGPKEVTYEAIQGLTYLDMVLAETFRMYPSLMTIDRVCERNCLIPLSPSEAPLNVKAGEVLMIPIYALHHDPEYFPDPFKFDPERFNEENIKNIKPNTYMPFGFGPRKCMGQRFAQVEIKLMLATLLHQFTFCVTSNTCTPLRIKKRNFLWVPEGGCYLGITLRN